MADKKLLHIDDENFDAEVLGSNEPFLLDFSAVWCAPCKTMLPLVEALAAEEAGRVRVGKIDADDSPKVAARFGVRSLPTVLVFENGKEKRRHVGACSKEKLRALLA